MQILKHTIEVPAFRDDNNKPCCALDFEKGIICPFFRTVRMGLGETCVFAKSHGRHTELLQRRKNENGEHLGTLIPIESCPIWAKEMQKEENQS